MKEILTDELIELFAERYEIIKVHFENGGFKFAMTFEQYVEKQLQVRAYKLEKKGVASR